MSDEKFKAVAAAARVTVMPGDFERIQQGIDDGVNGVADVVSELLRARGALLDVVLKVSASANVPEWLRAEAARAIKEAVLR